MENLDISTLDILNIDWGANFAFQIFTFISTLDILNIDLEVLDLLDVDVNVLDDIVLIS